MLSRLLPYLLALAAALLAWSESERADAIGNLLENSQASVRRLSQDNLDLKAAVERQNSETLELKRRMSVEALEAAARASALMGTLPEKTAADHKHGEKPEEVNQWLDSLFSY